MAMVLGASGGEKADAVVPRDAREIFPERRKHFGGDQVLSFFRAKYAVNEDVGIFVGHATNIHIIEPGCRCGISRFECAVPKRDPRIRRNTRDQFVFGETNERRAVR